MTAGSTPAAPADKSSQKIMGLLTKPINFIKEVKAELMKVTWSTRRELLGATMVVIGVTSILTVFIGIIDLFLSKGLSVLFR